MDYLAGERGTDFYAKGTLRRGGYYGKGGSGREYELVNKETVL